MKKVLLTLATIVLLSSNIIAAELKGGTGLEIMKIENGSYLYTPFISGDYIINPHFMLKGMFTENFSVMRGGSLIVPNHHSFRYTIGAEWTPFSHLTVGFNWDNRWLIDGHDTIFIEEYSNNRNYIRIFYKF